MQAAHKGNMNKRLFQSAQRTIPYRQLFRNGICQVNDSYYTKSIEFQDINYQLSTAEDQTAIFENWCLFLNHFESTVHIQFTFINEKNTDVELEKIIWIPDRDDKFTEPRCEFRQILKDQYEKGNNGLLRKKYITFGIEAKSLGEAKLKLERIELEILNNFKIIGCRARPISGYERLRILHSIFNQGCKKNFRFKWEYVADTGCTTKDFIAPDSFTFSKNTFQLGDGMMGNVSCLQILASELTDRLLRDFLASENNQIVSIHIDPIPQAQAIKEIKRIKSNIDRMKIDEQKKAFKDGYSIDILPPDLQTYGDECEKRLDDLQNRNEKAFMVSFLMVKEAENKEKMENNLSAAKGIAEQYSCHLRSLDYMQDFGLMSCAPIGINLTQNNTQLTTSSTAIFVPFMTQELMQEGGIYYGLNALSNFMIIVDRKKLKNPNGLILGTPGSGKSFSAKREIVGVILTTTDDIMIVDPEREYAPLVEAFGGQVIKISQDSKYYINPLDLTMVYNQDDDDYDPLKNKSNFILSLCEQILSNHGLEPVERSLIDRCVLKIYEPYLKDPKPENMPILTDLYEALKKQDHPVAQQIADALELYVTGSMNVFNHHTNIDINNRIVCFDIKDLGTNLKKLGMLIMQDQVWSRVTMNREAGKSTRYYADEFHLLLRDEQTAAASVEIWKRFRKWGGIPTGITQNVKDLLASREITNIFENSDFIYLLNQSGGDQEILAKFLHISPYQLSYVTNAQAGEGLIIYDGIIVPFVDRFPQDTKLYQLMTTKPDEIKAS